MFSDDNSALIDAMTLEQKVGQLFLLAYPGKDPQKIAPLAQRFGISGCYLSNDNAETFEEARVVSAALQRMAAQQSHQLPMLLGVDQEGAWGVLIGESHTGPGNLALGALADRGLVSEVYRLLGEEMGAVGYNTLLAPCADTNSDPRSPIIGTRSFGEEYQSVATLVTLAVQGAHQSGALATLKHFPGHGATRGDTHREIPLVAQSRDELIQGHLIPFAAGITAGADIVMTSHIGYPQIDSDTPATLSHKILQGLLREQLNFQGVILSDSMNMGAIRRHYNPAESTLLALQAGVDIVMLSEEHYDHDSDYLDKQVASLELVCRAIRHGALSPQCVDEKLQRIIALKKKISAPKGPMLSGRERDDIERRAAYEAIALLSDDWNIFPVSINHTTLCLNATPQKAYRSIVNPRGIGPNQRTTAFDIFWNTLSSAGRGVRKIEYEEVERYHSVLEKADRLIVVTEDYPLPGEDMPKTQQQELVRKCVARYGNKTLVIGLRSPYELAYYPPKISYLCSYSSRACSAEACARLLLEGAQPLGVNHGGVREHAR